MPPPAVELIDTHAHLVDERFQHDLPEVLQRAAAAGLTRIITIATTAQDSSACVLLATSHPLLAATVGIQPNNVAEAGPTDWDAIVKFSADPSATRIVALGETGLDRYWDRTPFPQQEDYFARHLELARQRKLPVVIHCREAEADVVRMLRADYEKHGPVRGVMHSFTGDAATAVACVEMGLFISFAGMLTYKNSEALRETAKTIPVARLLVETDSPYLSPVPLRGKRNEPAHVVHTATSLAELHHLTLPTLAHHTSCNARALFSTLRAD